MARERMDQERFQAHSISMVQISQNLRVLATFRTQEPGSSNLTIRRGIFTKTTGKLNLLKGIVRDAQDSLTNQAVLNEILTNLARFSKHYLHNPTDETWDILCNAMYGFLNLGSKYRNRGDADNPGNIGNIVRAMSVVCGQAKQLFLARLHRFNFEQNAAYSQGVYNAANNVHRGGTCWAMVMDWSRRFVLKQKMGYAHDPKYQIVPYNQNKLLHRGKYIAHVHGLPQNTNFDDVGAAIKAMAPAQKATTEHLVQQYYAEQTGSKKTVEEKFSTLSYRVEGDLGLGHDIHIGNQQRQNCTNALTAKVSQWIARSEAAHRQKQFSLFAHGIAFFTREDIGFQHWGIHSARQANEAPPIVRNMFAPPRTPTIDQRFGHELGFAYDPQGKKCYFMDPNYGEWVFHNDPIKVAQLIYDVLKTYTAGAEMGFSNPLNICRSINSTRHGLFFTNSP